MTITAIPEQGKVIDDIGAFRENRNKWIYTACTRAESGLTILTKQ